MKLTYNIESCVKDEKLRNNADFIMLVYKQKLTKWINSCTRECQLNSIKSSYEDLYTTSLVRALTPLIEFYSETESDKIKNRDVKFMEEQFEKLFGSYPKNILSEIEEVLYDRDIQIFVTI